MYSGYITDIKGISVGHWTDREAATGCTAVVAKDGAVCGCDVRGGSPGTRETDLARPGHMVTKAHAVILAGGSAFGLAAASGAMDELEREGIGLDTGSALVPIVPGAVIYDLAVGRADVRPGEETGAEAVRTASANLRAQGSVGAGAGATVGKYFGMKFAEKSGLGSAAVEAGGALVSAIVVVNALGDVYDEKGRIIAGAHDDIGFLDTASALISGRPPEVAIGTNTTIGVVATDAALTKEQANKLASAAHNGLAMSIRPVHTMYDGDTVFALATGERKAPADITALIYGAAEAMRRAVVNAVMAAGGDN